MKQKALILCAVVFLNFFLTQHAFGFWIWSTKSQKWRNPEYSPLASPKAQFDKALKAYKDRDFISALKEFKKLIIHFPDSTQAPLCQFYIGECYNNLDNKYRAFTEYQKVINSYPYSKKIDEVVRKEYEIGEYFLRKPRKKWLGVPVSDLFEHPAIEIFTKVKDNSPYSEYAIMATYKLGLLFYNLKRYQEAIDSFKEIIEKHPESKWSEAARYQLALCSSEASLGSEYDQELTEEAKKRFKEFLTSHPDAKLSETVLGELNRLTEKEAKKEFEIGLFYEQQKHYKAALIYYRYVSKHFPGTDWAEKAKDKMIDLKDKEELK